MEYREAEYQRYQERLSEMDRQVPVKKCKCLKEITANDLNKLRRDRFRFSGTKIVHIDILRETATIRPQ